MKTKILTIGQSDSSAGTGIQADLKTAQSFGVYAANVITAVMAQNTCEVSETYAVPADMVMAQVEAIMADLDIAALKTGMLASEETIAALGDMFDHMGETMGDDRPRVVIDPVMTNRTGRELLSKPARDIMKRSLILYADILTPNIMEAQELTGLAIKDIDDMCHAAEMLRTLGPRTVILKGGALKGDQIYDILSDENGTEIYATPVVPTRSTHGAGSTLSAGLTCGLALGLDHRRAFEIVRAYLDDAMTKAMPVGKGYGPVNHAAGLVAMDAVRSKDTQTAAA